MRGCLETPVLVNMCVSQYRIRFSKFVNKKLLKTVSTVFREWVHQDKETTEVKLRLVRTLTSDDEQEKAMLETARAHVGAVLVSYAQGNPRVKTVKPYGLKAGRSTTAFKELPSATLSLTYAALYQVVRTDPLSLDKWIKTPRHSITHPWPRGMIKRFVQLHDVFEKYRWQVFNAYEETGGEYMGDEATTTSSTVDHTPAEDLFEEDFD